MEQIPDEIKNLGKIEIPKTPGIFDFLDATVASDLEIDIETYKDIIDNKCTYSEAKFIIFAVLSERSDKIQKAKDLVQSKIQ
jgi:hypothetical protein